MCMCAAEPSIGQHSGNNIPDTAVVGNEILFTKVAGKGQFGREASDKGVADTVSDTRPSQSRPDAVRLQLSHEAVSSIENNAKRYEDFLRKRSHQADSQFNPWTAVEQ